MSRDATVDQLLHDAEHASSGIMMAQMMGDTAYVAQAREKRAMLIRDALALDPQMADDAWGAVDPEVRQLADTQPEMEKP